MKEKKSRVITQRAKANLYITMGIMLIAITIVWVNVQVVPKVVVLVTGILGVIPVIVMVAFDHDAMDKKALACWRGAFSDTVLILMVLLFCLWIFVCMCKVIDPINIDVCYMIPCLAGATYILVGDNYKTYEDCLEEIDE